MPDYRKKLQDLLIELFQFDAADLDFGIYAVMNHKRDQVARFIEHDLLDALRDGLQLQSAAQRGQAEADYRRARQALEQEAGSEFAIFEANGALTPMVCAMPGQTVRRLRDDYQHAKAAYDEASLSAELEAQTYNDLYRFFSRYYDDGDFISQRRYGAGNKYAIPYNGEEVTLYWANFDQYYVKTGEYFNDYRFAVEPSIGFERASVSFKLRAASVAQDNVKGEKRFFVLAAPAPVAWDAAGRVLTVGFEYRPLTDGEKLRYGSRDQQDKLLAEAEPAVLKAASDPLLRDRLGQRTGEPGKEKSLLARHLARYTARNTRDYFIHKDLQGFLTRELDFFLKSEVLRLEDLDFDRPATVQTTAARLQTIRLIAGRIIEFLAQIEDFQRRLWEKRKFVVQSDYCVTLDRVPPELYPEIAANDRQRAEWRKLYGLALGPDADLSQHPFAMADTAFFDAGFKARLLASFADLDTDCDGLLVHGENYGALRLLTPRYREQVKCIYIDPPYNTGSDGFPYKDSFQHSSWTAMMESRLELARDLLAPNGVISVSVDDHEDHNLRHLMGDVFEDDNFVAQLVWEKGRKNDAKLFSVGHEYMTVYARSLETLRLLGTVWREPKPGAQEIWDEYCRLRDLHGDNDVSIESALQDWYRELPKGHPSKVLTRYRHVDKYGPWRDRDISWPGGNGPKYDVIHPVTKRPCRVPERGWGFATSESMQRQIRLGLVVFRDDHTQPPFRKAHLHPIPDELDEENGLTVADDEIEETVVGMQVMPSVIYKQSQVAVKYLRNLMREKVFDNPKDHEVLARVIGYCTSRVGGDAILDFFAGSGTTAHAVINLNRDEGSNRKYVLVEMADYFDTVLKPRIQKVAYAADWRDGKPVAGSAGQSHMFQYIRLESYEDSLNNIRFRELSGPLLAALEKLPDYTLRYMLDFETQGSPSLLDPAQFERPFDYTLDVTRDGVTQPRAVDLVATFNFLLGLRVRRETRFLAENGALGPVVRVTGEDAAGRRVCVLWRDAPPLEEMEAEKAWLLTHVLEDVAYDVLYINGESALPAALPIEPEFRRLMFEGVR